MSSHPRVCVCVHKFTYVFISLFILKTMNSHQYLHFSSQTTVFTLVFSLSTSNSKKPSSIMLNIKLLIWSISLYVASLLLLPSPQQVSLPHPFWALILVLSHCNCPLCGCPLQPSWAPKLHTGPPPISKPSSFLSSSNTLAGMAPPLCEYPSHSSQLEHSAPGHLLMQKRPLSCSGFDTLYWVIPHMLVILTLLDSDTLSCMDTSFLTLIRLHYPVLLTLPCRCSPHPTQALILCTGRPLPTQCRQPHLN